MELAKQKLKVATDKAAELLIENGLADWRIEIRNTRTSLADTYHQEKIIVFSKRFILVATEEQFIGVTLHEIAHAMLGGGFGHSEEFVALCKKISPTDKYAVPEIDIRIRSYIYECSGCGASGGSNRRTDAYCSSCFEKGDVIKFTRRKNEIVVTQWWASTP